jgi:ribose-phosphate pyrophosphokinase
VTDTVPLDREAPTLTMLSVAPLLADTIESIFANRSVSAIFAGQEVF